MENFTPLKIGKQKKKINKLLLFGNLFLVLIVALIGIFYYNRTLLTTIQKAIGGGPAKCGSPQWAAICPGADDCEEVYEGCRIENKCTCDDGSKKYCLIDEREDCGGDGGGGNKQCNQICVNDNSCASGLVCYKVPGKIAKRCRNPSCQDNEDCVCPTSPTLTPTPLTVTNTPTPTIVVTNTPTPTRVITNTPTPTVTLTVSPTITLTPSITPTGSIPPTLTPTSTPRLTSTLTPTVPPGSTSTPTPPAGSTATPIPVLCGTKDCDDETNPCRSEYLCVQAHDGSNYCTSADFAEACKSNPSYNTCCIAPGEPTATLNPTEIILAKTSISPTLTTAAPVSGVVTIKSILMYIIPLAIIGLGILL